MGNSIDGFLESGDILFADRLEILKPWRGAKYGIEALNGILQLAGEEFCVSTCCFKPYPLQFQGYADHKPVSSETLRAFKAARQKLADYYVKNLSAERIPRSDEYYFVRVERKN